MSGNDINMKKNKEKKKNVKNREEFGAGYDISTDDLKVLGQNEAAKKHNKNDGK